MCPLMTQNQNGELWHTARPEGGHEPKTSPMSGSGANVEGPPRHKGIVYRLDQRLDGLVAWEAEEGFEVAGTDLGPS